MNARPDCPGCGHLKLSEPFCLPSQPVVLNYRFKSPEEASSLVRRDVTLRQCEHCGLVFNSTFDLEAIPYDENYENRQSFSPAFQQHLESLADSLIESNSLKDGRILEVGCGKGDFLRLICGRAQATGAGYDTSYEPGPEPAGLTFHRQYLAGKDVTSTYDAVICRHVIEHVPEIGAFLSELRQIALAAGDPVVVLETPNFEWIVEQLSLWDIFYEHCNYFPMPSLAFLCERAGFRTLRQSQAFGGQYQILELQALPTPEIPSPPGIPSSARLSDFADQARRHLKERIHTFSQASEGRPWAIWGAGAKGVALANQLGECLPSAVIDSNPAKQGGVLPGTTIPILSPDDPTLPGMRLIVIANPNYAEEIESTLFKKGFSGRLMTL